MTLPGIQPEALPRGEVIDAEKRLVEVLAGKLGVEREYEEWLRARGVRSEKFSAMHPKQEETVSYTFGPLQSWPRLSRPGTRRLPSRSTCR